MAGTKKTTINFNYDGTDYKLEFTADSLKRMQQTGFNFGDIGSQLLTVGEDLFAGAFIANHSNVPRKKRLKIYHELVENDDNGDALVDVLSEMVNEAMDEINNHVGNVKWEVVR